MNLHSYYHAACLFVEDLEIFDIFTIFGIFSTTKTEYDPVGSIWVVNTSIRPTEHSQAESVRFDNSFVIHYGV